MSIADLRREYQQGALLEQDLDPDPIGQFQRWFKDATAAGILDPNAMTLATASQEGDPSARIVLLKAFDSRGFCFFTNDQSQKAKQIAQNPRASLVFFWGSLDRQVRINGTVSLVDPKEADAYFASRPRNSQLGAWASQQSQTIESREALEQAFAQVCQKYAQGSIPTPPAWRGFRVEPQIIEFWQGQPSRLHDRFAYTKQENGKWNIRRLAP